MHRYAIGLLIHQGSWRSCLLARRGGGGGRGVRGDCLPRVELAVAARLQRDTAGSKLTAGLGRVLAALPQLHGRLQLPLLGVLAGLRGTLQDCGIGVGQDPGVLQHLLQRHALLGVLHKQLRQAVGRGGGWRR